MGFGNEEKLKRIAWTTVNGFEKKGNEESVLIIFDGNGGQCVNNYLILIICINNFSISDFVRTL